MGLASPIRVRNAHGNLFDQPAGRIQSSITAPRIAQLCSDLLVALAKIRPID
jgi:hypothetical protein